jgi:ribosomal protein L11 methyltransferase
MLIDLDGKYLPEKPNEILIKINPGIAFGDGKHPTTQLCLQALERHLRPGQTVLDLGTGSGILSIAAAKLGAGKILGVDNLPEAVNSARENSSLNHTDSQVNFIEGSIDAILNASLGDVQYGIVVANISLSVILNAFEIGLARFLIAESLLILSGFLNTQTTPIKARLFWHNLKFLAHEKKGDWACIIAGRS